MESDWACFCKGNLQCIDEQMNTVCIATYNGEKYIVAQLKSILEQLQPKDEIVVSDDGSTDNTIAKIESVGDKRVRVIHSGYHMVKRISRTHCVPHAEISSFSAIKTMCGYPASMPDV